MVLERLIIFVYYSDSAVACNHIVLFNIFGSSKDQLKTKFNFIRCVANSFPAAFATLFVYNTKKSSAQELQPKFDEEQAKLRHIAHISWFWPEIQLEFHLQPLKAASLCYKTSLIWHDLKRCLLICYYARLLCSRCRFL
ncbi:hypothetical protein AMTRI_Chr05g58030 [Amborella trichopoda]